MHHKQIIEIENLDVKCLNENMKKWQKQKFWGRLRISSLLNLAKLANIAVGYLEN
jgi:hypothetical protein